MVWLQNQQQASDEVFLHVDQYGRAGLLWLLGLFGSSQMFCSSWHHTKNYRTTYDILRPVLQPLWQLDIPWMACRCFNFEVVNSSLVLPSMLHILWFSHLYQRPLESLNIPFTHVRFPDDFVFQWAAGTHFSELWLCHCLLPGSYGCLAEFALCSSVWRSWKKLLDWKGLRCWCWYDLVWYFIVFVMLLR